MAKLGMCSKIANSLRTLQKPHRELMKVCLLLFKFAHIFIIATYVLP